MPRGVRWLRIMWDVGRCRIRIKPTIELPEASVEGRIDDAPTDLEGKMFKVEEVVIDAEPLLLQGCTRLYDVCLHLTIFLEEMECLWRGLTVF